MTMCVARKARGKLKLIWLVHLCGLALVLVPDRGRASDPIQEDRVLPIRGAAIIDRMREAKMQTIPAVFVSPDGRRFLSYQLETDYLKTSKARPTNLSAWMYDIKSGKRLEISGLAITPSRRTVATQGRPEWSRDGRTVAVLRSQGAKLTLSRWDALTGRALPPVMLPTPDKVAQAVMTDWIWLSERQEAVARFRLAPLRGASEGQQNASPTAWFWSLEQDAEATKQRLALASRDQVRFVTVRFNIDRQSYKIIHIDNDYATTGNRGNLAITPDRAKILFVGAGPRTTPLSPAGSEGLKALMYSDAGGYDQSALEFNNRVMAVHSVDLKSGLVEDLYLSSKTEIPSLAFAGRTSDLLLSQIDPSLGNKRFSSWANVLRVGRANSRGSSAITLKRAIWGDSELFSGFLRDTAFYFSSAVDGTLYEINTKSGKESRLNPSGMAVTAADVSADGRTVVAVLENVGTPPRMYIWTQTDRKWRMIGEPAPDIVRDLGFGSLEFINWRSKDPSNLLDSGVLFKPTTFNARRPLPLIIFTNGGGLDRTVPWANRYASFRGGCGGVLPEVLSSEGYLVLEVNHRRSAGMSPEHEQALAKHFGTQVEFDIGAAIDFLAAKGWADPAKVGICGSSAGGVEVAIGLANTNLFKAAVANDAVVSSRDQLGAYHKRELLNGDVATWGWDAVSTFDQLFGYDPVQTEMADPFKFKSPLLLRWSVPDDQNIKEKGMGVLSWTNPGLGRRQSEPIMYAMKKNRVPNEVIIDPDGHGVENPDYMLEWNSRVIQWFDYFVRGSGPNPLPAMVMPLGSSGSSK